MKLVSVKRHFEAIKKIDFYFIYIFLISNARTQTNATKIIQKIQFNPCVLIRCDIKCDYRYFNTLLRCNFCKMILKMAAIVASYKLQGLDLISTSTYKRRNIIYFITIVLLALLVIVNTCFFFFFFFLLSNVNLNFC